MEGKDYDMECGGVGGYGIGVWNRLITDDLRYLTNYLSMNGTYGYESIGRLVYVSTYLNLSSG